MLIVIISIMKESFFRSAPSLIQSVPPVRPTLHTPENWLHIMQCILNINQKVSLPVVAYHEALNGSHLIKWLVNWTHNIYTQMYPYPSNLFHPSPPPLHTQNIYTKKYCYQSVGLTWLTSLMARIQVVHLIQLACKLRSYARFKTLPTNRVTNIQV